MADISEALELLKYLKYSSQFPDFPKTLPLSSLTDPNYVAPNRSHCLLVFAYLATIASTAAVLLRLYARSKTRRNFGIDDWLIIPALVFTLAFICIEIVLIQHFGVGKHVFDLKFSMFRTALHLEFVGVLMYYSAVYFTKMSIVAFLYRLFDNTSKTMRMVLHITATVYTLIFLASIISYCLSCTPLAAIWDILVREEPNAHCVNMLSMIMAFGVLYAVADFWLLCLPLSKLWQLQLPLSSKIGVVLVMSLGSVACFGAALKTAFIGGLYDTYDPTWNCLPSLWGALIEVTAGIISASLPALSGLIVRTGPRRLKAWLSHPSGRRSIHRDPRQVIRESRILCSGGSHPRAELFKSSIQVRTTMETKESVRTSSIRSIMSERSDNFLAATISKSVLEMGGTERLDGRSSTQRDGHKQSGDRESLAESDAVWTLPREWRCPRDLKLSRPSNDGFNDRIRTIRGSSTYSVTIQGGIQAV